MNVLRTTLTWEEEKSPWSSERSREGIEGKQEQLAALNGRCQQLWNTSTTRKGTMHPRRPVWSLEYGGLPRNVSHSLQHLNS